MDLTPAMIQFIKWLCFLIPLAILMAVLRSPWFKGVTGEFLVNVRTKLSLDKKTYHLIKNVTLPTEDGTTQIDHIIVSVYGVFVVETKNMKGWIFGSEHQKAWTQKIFNHSSQFQNPLCQNYKHVKTLASYLDLDEQQIYSVVVFVGKSIFKTDMPENVTTGGDYIRFIKSKKRKVLTKSKVAEIIAKIEDIRFAPSLKTNREHVKHVRSIVTEKRTSQAPLCPKCGNPMVMRITKKGQNAGKKFWGCSNFPSCRGVVTAGEKGEKTCLPSM